MEFIPFQSNQLSEIAPGLTTTQASESLHAITVGGHQIRGARAVFEVMSQLPGLLGWIGKILKLPPFYWFAEPFYRLFAQHRNKVTPAR